MTPSSSLEMQRCCIELRRRKDVTGNVFFWIERKYEKQSLKTGADSFKTTSNKSSP